MMSAAADRKKEGVKGAQQSSHLCDVNSYHLVYVLVFNNMLVLLFLRFH